MDFVFESNEKSPKNNFNWLNTCDQILNDSIKISKVDRSLYIYQQLDKYIKNEILPKCKQLSEKDVKKSKQFRGNGNKQFTSKNYLEALKFYSDAILYAPDGSELLALAYGNRSAVYFQMNKYFLAIEDIDLALTNHDYSTINVNWQKKLLFRKLKCIVHLTSKSAEETKQRLSRINNNDNGEMLKENFQLLTETFSKKQEHENKDKVKVALEKIGPDFDYGLYSSKVNICYNETKGRHLKAKKQINPGDVIIVERPYAKILLGKYEKEYCHECLRKLNPSKMNIVPCQECINVLYCSATCRNRSWKEYHRFECCVLLFLHEFGVGQLAVRIILQTNFNDFIKASKSICSPNTNIQVFKNADRNLFKLPYDAVYCLLDHMNDERQLLSFNLSSFLIIQLLNFKAELIQTIQSLFFKIVVNAHGIFDDKIMSTTDCDFSFQRYASGIYPALSILNHSCNPNVVPLFEYDGICLIRASKSISIGEEINCSYGINFSKFSYTERQYFLYNQYHFHCNCSICEHEGKEILKEDKYREHLLELEKNSNKFLSGNEELLELFAKELLAIYNNIKCTQYPSNKLIIIGAFFDQISKRYHRIFTNHTKALHYCQLSVDCVEQLFGCNSLEFSNEMIKLSDLAFVAYTKTGHFPLTKVMELTKKTLKLLEQYTLFFDADEDDDFIDSGYYLHEFKRLSKQLKQLN